MPPIITPVVGIALTIITAIVCTVLGASGTTGREAAVMGATGLASVVIVIVTAVIEGRRMRTR